MSYHARTILTPGASRKRKERESFYASAAATAAAKPTARPAPAPAQVQAAAKEGPAAEPPAPAAAMSDNRLLAGYMAHEFLTMGTLLGSRPEAAAAAARDGEPPPKQPQPQPQPPVEEEVGKKASGSYGEVASILKADGVHVPGILNPSHLARWIQM